MLSPSISTNHQSLYKHFTTLSSFSGDCVVTIKRHAIVGHVSLDVAIPIFGSSPGGGGLPSRGFEGPIPDSTTLSSFSSDCVMTIEKHAIFCHVSLDVAGPIFGSSTGGGGLPSQGFGGPVPDSMAWRDVAAKVEEGHITLKGKQDVVARYSMAF